jgi:hypothetical protein
MNPFLLRTEDRLSHWKEFRKSLSAMDEIQQLVSVAHYWSRAPLVSIAYDTSDALSWSTPWEMIRTNKWCRRSIAIGMENTLRLAGFPAHRMSLRLIIDRDIQDVLLILVIDETWVLNYDWGSVIPYPKTNHAVMKAWNFIDKSYISRI